MIFRISFLVVATVVAVAVSQKKQKSSIKHKDLEKDGSNLQDIEEEEKAGEVQEKEEATAIRNEMEKAMEPNSPCKLGCGEDKFLIRDNKLNNSDKSDTLWNLVKEFEQRKVTLKRKSLELHGIKEQQSYNVRLQRNLEEKMAEMSTLTVSINLLWADTNDLKKEIKDSILAQKRLEIAKKIIEKMQRKVDTAADHVKRQLMILEEKVSGLQIDKFSHTDTMVKEKLRAIKNVELKIFELWRKNKELELEKRELAIKLVDAQNRITAFSNLTESKIIDDVEEELSTLKRANEDLSKQVERLQKNRFDVVEELVYQRWLNTCLRIETQNYPIQSRKLSKRDLSSNSNQKSHEETDQPASDLEPDFDSISSCTSSTDIDKNDSSTNENSSSSQRSSIRKSILIFNVKKWRRSKDDYNAVLSPEKSSKGNSAGRNGLIRRFSASMVPSKPSMLCGKDDSANNTPTNKKKVQDLQVFPRARRVSFSDYVTTITSTFEDMPKSVEEVLHSKEMSTENSSQDSNVNSSPCIRAELVKEKQEFSSLETSAVAKVDSPLDVNGQPSKKDVVGTKLDNRIEIAHPEELHSRVPNVLPSENKDDMNIMHLIAVIFIFCFILLACFALLAFGIY